MELGTLNSFVVGTTIQPTPVNQNFADIRTAFNSYAVLTDVTKAISVTHDWGAAQDFHAGTAALPGIYLNGDTDTGLFQPGADIIGISVSGSEIFRVDISGVDVQGAITATGVITATGGFSGDGSALTGLDASVLASGTVPSGRVTGAYTGITGVGTLASGVWNGTVITAPYGGTGHSSYATGDLLYAIGTSGIGRLSVGNPGQVLSVSAGGLPTWGSSLGERFVVPHGYLPSVQMPSAGGSAWVNWSGNESDMAFVCPRDGSITGISLRWAATSFSSGSVDVEVYVNGVATGFYLTITTADGLVAHKAATQATGFDPVAAGDYVQLRVIADGSYVATGDNIGAAAIEITADA